LTRVHLFVLNSAVGALPTAEHHNSNKLPRNNISCGMISNTIHEFKWNVSLVPA